MSVSVHIHKFNLKLKFRKEKKKGVQILLNISLSQMCLCPCVLVVQGRTTVKHYSCHCRKVWRETCSSECTLSQASSDHSGVTGRSVKSSGSRRSTIDRTELTQCSYTCLMHHISRLRCISAGLGVMGGAWYCTFPQLLQWCFLRITVKGALQAMQELQASSGTHSGGSKEKKYNK